MQVITITDFSPSVLARMESPEMAKAQMIAVLVPDHGAVMLSLEPTARTDAEINALKGMDAIRSAPPIAMLLTAAAHQLPVMTLADMADCTVHIVPDPSLH